MFKLPEAWVWDFWLVDDGRDYHLFFLYASRALKDPHARHYRASVGHAVSSDLVHWERVVDALVRSDAPALRRPRHVDRVGRAAPGRAAGSCSTPGPR